MPPGGEYKERKGGIKMEDYIDFPCSDDWYRYYYERGLTYRNPKIHEDTSDEMRKEIEELKRKIKRLEEKREHKNNLEWF